MRSRRLDRRITIQAKSITQNEFGEEVLTWPTIATVWAEKRNSSGGERFTAQQFVGHGVSTFRFRWSDVVNVVTIEHRIVFDGREYDIKDVKEINRREGIEVDCTVRSEEPVSA